MFVTKQLMHKGKRVGFIVTDGKSERMILDKDLDSDKIKFIRNLSKDKRGFRLTKGYIKDFSKLNIEY